MNPRFLLVDGHSVIYAWKELRRLHQKKPALAREQLIKILQLLQDTSSWKVTVIFDGRFGTPPVQNPSEIIVGYSSQDQTADSIIERLVGQPGIASHVLVVTADEGERQTVEALGATTASPEWLQNETAFQEQNFQTELERVKKRAKW